MTEIPLKPVGKSDIKKLETALIFGTLFRPDVIERIKNAEDRLTWLDSLVVAAAAIAREKAGYTVRMIADEVGRSEATVRNHLEGKTEAGKLVRETLRVIAEAGGKLELKLPPELTSAPKEEGSEKLKKEIEEVREKVMEAKEDVEKTLRRVSEELGVLQQNLGELLQVISKEKNNKI